LGIGETCNCPATVKPCGCTLQVYGKLGNVIPIYRSGNVDDMTTAVAKIIKTYEDNIVFGELVDDFNERVDNIHVKLGSEILLKGKTVEVGCDATESDIGTYFVMICWDMIE